MSNLFVERIIGGFLFIVKEFCKKNYFFYFFLHFYSFTYYNKKLIYRRLKS